MITFHADNNEFVINIDNKEYNFTPKLYVYNLIPNKRNFSMMTKETSLVETLTNMETMFTNHQL